MSDVAVLHCHTQKKCTRNSMLVDCLTLLQELHVDDSPHVEERDHHERDLGPRLSCFLWPRRRWTLPLKALALGLRVIFEDPRLITSDDSAVSLAQFGDARGCFDTPLRATPSGHHSEEAPSSRISSAYPNLP